jgi:hypothetical protein
MPLTQSSTSRSPCAQQHRTLPLSLTLFHLCKGPTRRAIIPTKQSSVCTGLLQDACAHVAWVVGQLPLFSLGRQPCPSLSLSCPHLASCSPHCLVHIAFDHGRCCELRHADLLVDVRCWTWATPPCRALRPPLRQTLHVIAGQSPSRSRPSSSCGTRELALPMSLCALPTAALQQPRCRRTMRQEARRRVQGPAVSVLVVEVSAFPLSPLIYLQRTHVYQLPRLASMSCTLSRARCCIVPSLSPMPLRALLVHVVALPTHVVRACRTYYFACCHVLIHMLFAHIVIPVNRYLHALIK